MINTIKKYGIAIALLPFLSCASDPCLLDLNENIHHWIAKNTYFKSFPKEETMQQEVIVRRCNPVSFRVSNARVFDEDGAEVTFYREDDGARFYYIVKPGRYKLRFVSDNTHNPARAIKVHTTYWEPHEYSDKLPSIKRIHILNKSNE